VPAEEIPEDIRYKLSNIIVTMIRNRSLIYIDAIVFLEQRAYEQVQGIQRFARRYVDRCDTTGRFSFTHSSISNNKLHNIELDRYVCIWTLENS
jgi:hypothetical protein